MSAESTAEPIRGSQTLPAIVLSVAILSLIPSLVNVAILVAPLVASSQNLLGVLIIIFGHPLLFIFGLVLPLALVIAALFIRLSGRIGGAVLILATNEILGRLLAFTDINRFVLDPVQSIFPVAALVAALAAFVIAYKTRNLLLAATILLVLIIVSVSQLLYGLYLVGSLLFRS